jgi:hypothetical protein
MAPKLDPAILNALSLDASNTTLGAYGGSSFAFTGKLTSVVDGKEKLFFIKIGQVEKSERMFSGIRLLLLSSAPFLKPLER